MKKKFRFKKLTLPGLLVLILALLVSWYLYKLNMPVYSDSVQNVPEFSGEPFVVIADNEPEFFAEDLTEESYEYFSPLDNLGRCGYAMACVGQDLMPTEDRESISKVKPSGWVQNQYDFVDGKSLYNRCHLIGFQLTGENANELNLITGTRYCNVEGMLPFENMIADYVKETGNHVLYRVTPVYDGNNLVARGIQMEALSIEDGGAGVCFHVYVYNNQPGVTIDYATGDNWADGQSQPATQPEPTQSGATGTTYLLNTSSKKFHEETCAQGQGIKDSNAETFRGTRDELLAQGYEPAGCCKP
jgi:DNA-entry nuclease